MKTIKVLGTGCANCKNTYQLIENIAKDQGVEVNLEKVEELSEIMVYGVLSTPGVVIDERVVHAGGVPDKAAVENWLKDDVACCSSNDSSSSNGSCCG